MTSKFSCFFSLFPIYNGSLVEVFDMYAHLLCINIFTLIQIKIANQRLAIHRVGHNTNPQFHNGRCNIKLEQSWM